MLGEAYAFGVVWSFALKSLAVLVLRFKSPGEREWRVPVNLKIGRVELPIGLAAITLALFTVALVNLVTKQVATISGSLFTVVIYTAFVLSERATARRRQATDAAHRALDQFHLVPASDVGLRTGVGAAGQRAGARARSQQPRASQVGAEPHRHREAGHRGDDRAAPARARHRLHGTSRAIACSETTSRRSSRGWCRLPSARGGR